MAKTVLAMFDSFMEAQRVVEELTTREFDRDQVKLVAHASARENDRSTSKQATEHVETAKTRGLTQSLTEVGLPEDEARLYAEGVRRGGTLVYVLSSDEQSDEAAEIMRKYDFVDLEDRANFWRDRGWQAADQETEPFTRERIAKEREELNIPVVEEEMRVGKRDVERGGVRIRSYVTEQPFEESVRLRDETVHVERHSVDRPVSKTDATAFQEGVVEFTETDEEAVIEKRAHVVEEVRVGKDVEEHTETVRDTVRRKDVEIEEIDGGHYSEAEFERIAPSFQKHFETLPLRKRFTYDQARPAYRYGYGLAGGDRFRGRDWDEMEPEVRREWETRNEGSWDDFRESVRYSWNEARNRGQR